MSVFGWCWRSHVCLFVISVDRVHRPDAGQVPTLQESVSSSKQFIHHITSFSLYFYIVDLRPQAFSWSFYSVKPTVRVSQVVASGSFSRTGHTLVFFCWLKPVTLSLTSNPATHFPVYVCLITSWGFWSVGFSSMYVLYLRIFLQTTFLYHYLHKLLNVVSKVHGTLGTGISRLNQMWCKYQELLFQNKSVILQFDNTRIMNFCRTDKVKLQTKKKERMCVFKVFKFSTVHYLNNQNTPSRRVSEICQAHKETGCLVSFPTAFNFTGCWKQMYESVSCITAIHRCTMTVFLSSF